MVGLACAECGLGRHLGRVAVVRNGGTTLGNYHRNSEAFVQDGRDAAIARYKQTTRRSSPEYMANSMRCKLVVTRPHAQMLEVD
jgi:hypothetical protein